MTSTTIQQSGPFVPDIKSTAIALPLAVTADDIGGIAGQILEKGPALRSGALDLAEQELMTPGTPAHAKLQQSRESKWYAASLPEHLEFLGKLGQEASRVSGVPLSELRVIDAIFGGADSHTAFAVFPFATDVVSFGVEPFGTPEILERYAKVGYPEEKAGAQYSGFESARDLHELRSGGLGRLMVSRIQAFLSGHVESISYFELNSDGSLALIAPHDATPNSCAAITFSVPGSEPEQRVTKRHWYLPCNVYDSTDLPDAFFAFRSALASDALMIKGANDMWTLSDKVPEAEAQFQRARAFDVLRPVCDRDAVIISDNCTNHDFADSGYKPHPIWKSPPRSACLSGKESFGYSKEGSHVYFGRGSQLSLPARMPEA